MYDHLNYWGLIRHPFRNVPDTEFFFKTPNHTEAFSRMWYVARGGMGAAMLTGDIGCGKTLLCFKLLEELKRRKYDSVVITNPCFSATEFLQQIYQQLCGHPVPTGKREIMEALARRGESKSLEEGPIVILIDEAHLVTKSPSLYEEIRMLLNYQRGDRFFFTLLLVGQPELESHIAHIPQLRQRVHLKYHLTPLNVLETYNYVLHRLKYAECRREVFSLPALEEIYSLSQGVPRVINTICDLSMLAAYLAKHNIVESKDVLNARGLIA